jgi:ketol-acid reductoisomerase
MNGMKLAAARSIVAGSGATVAASESSGSGTQASRAIATSWRRESSTELTSRETGTLSGVTPAFIEAAVKIPPSQHRAASEAGVTRTGVRTPSPEGSLLGLEP